MAASRIAHTSLPVRTSFTLGVLLVVGCADGPTAPAMPTPPPSAPQPFGLMEITLTGVTTPAAMAASARRLTPDGVTATSIASGTVMTQSLALLEEDGRRGIQLDALTTGSFTRGTRGADGQRYVSATFRVRNASSDGVAYTTPADNVTLLPVSTGATIGDTPVTGMLRFDGTAAPTSLAAQLRPTGAVTVGSTGEITAPFPDAFQAFTEAEAAEIALDAGLDNVFPYGFVVRNALTRMHRRLDASPAIDQFDGIVTLAFRLPLAVDPADDAWEIRVLVLATSDTEARITQSFEEQTICQNDLAIRADSLDATTVTMLGGSGTYLGGRTTRDVAEVRTAGLPGAPTATLPDAVTDGYPAAPTVLDLSDVTQLTAVLWSVEPSPRPDADLMARYGYYNPGPDVINLPLGGSNHFTPAPANRGQPVSFLPGLHLPPDFVLEAHIFTLWVTWVIEMRAVESGAVLRAPPDCVYY